MVNATEQAQILAFGGLRLDGDGFGRQFNGLGQRLQRAVVDLVGLGDGQEAVDVISARDFGDMGAIVERGKVVLDAVQINLGTALAAQDAFEVHCLSAWLVQKRGNEREPIPPGA